jgi:hypothetical protein
MEKQVPAALAITPPAQEVPASLHGTGLYSELKQNALYYNTVIQLNKINA